MHACAFNQSVSLRPLFPWGRRRSMDVRALAGCVVAGQSGARAGHETGDTNVRGAPTYVHGMVGASSGRAIARARAAARETCRFPPRHAVPRSRFFRSVSHVAAVPCRCARDGARHPQWAGAGWWRCRLRYTWNLWAMRARPGRTPHHTVVTIIGLVQYC